MKHFKVGDHVEWNSEAGTIRGTVIRVVKQDLVFHGRLRHCSADEPQYQLKSDKTGRLAMHKVRALHKLPN